MAEQADFETRPISDEVWGRMKNLRREHWQHTWKAQAEGELCVTGLAWQFQPLLAGFGDFASPSMGTGFIRAAREGTRPNGLRKYVDIATAQGLTPMCGAIGAHLGQVYEGISFQSPSGEKITPDFIFQPHGCHAIYKGAQICSEILGLPMLMIELPTTNNTENTREYIIAQLADAIEWIEKRTKKKFDDEKFVAAVRYASTSKVLWAKVTELMKTTPSPISLRQAMSLNIPIISYPHSKGTMEYMKALYAEIQERAQDGIAGTPFEKKRLNHEGIHPLYRPDILRWPEEYGAAFIGGTLSRGYGAYIYTEDGHAMPGKTPEERGMALRSREEAIRAMVYLNLPPEGAKEAARTSTIIQSARDWHADGVILHMARRCPAGTCGIFDRKADLLAAGIPVATYEASEADPNEFDEAHVREDFERFLESLGLTKISAAQDSQTLAEDNL